jgi:hypothetical protein
MIHQSSLLSDSTGGPMLTPPLSQWCDFRAAMRDVHVDANANVAATDNNERQCMSSISRMLRGANRTLCRGPSQSVVDWRHRCTCHRRNIEKILLRDPVAALDVMLGLTD